MTDNAPLFLGPMGRIVPSPAGGAAGMAQSLARTGGNAGNLIFQLATAQMIDMPLRPMGGAHGYNAPAGTAPLVLPAANHLRPADWAPLTRFLEGAQRPIAVFGLGADSANTPALRQSPSLMRLVAVLRERAIAITFRGARSAAIGADLGLNGVVLGCPSIFLNPLPDLGSHITRELQRAAWRPGLRCAIHAGDPFNPRTPTHSRAEQIMFRYVATGLAQHWILPSGGGTACAAAAGQIDAPESLSRALGHVDATPILARAGYVPFSARSWIARLRGVDLALGTRAHGALAGLAAGTPAPLTPIDARTSELAQTMHLPTLPLDALTRAATPQDAIASVAFSPAAFDTWRCTAAGQMAALLRGIGLRPAPHLDRLAAA
ncbi:hypothetical protein BVG79_02145 [Ketogulonicigenium robustum]|uniref:Polysaccharide pyruvyl transferase domain-containing protein n=1 Tax=Ketogulonicigenium robustum TaxID=92947 RepID=A0A1W6P1V0_9RHOB|nr:hypothetical protein [Ketogulonicigenium robustum]ARO15485.1 hypothetical protein BVG79_02145 [Ketogulonicigenium robustum]